MSKELTHFTAAFNRFRVGICGDMILDRYVYGNATRISQEAPVPVVLWKNERLVLGGAANVAHNIATLSGKAVPFGVIGRDEAARSLSALMTELDMPSEGLVVSNRRLTTQKTRLIAGNQQVVRLDREEVMPLDDSERIQAKQAIERAILNHEIDALIFEDYAKGFLDAELISYAQRLASENGIMTSLDPHPSNAFNMPGLTLMTPNRKEAFQLAGQPLTAATDDPLTDAPLLKTGEILMNLWNPELLLVTLGSRGMILFRRNSEPFHIPTLARQVFDVSGAGDTVMATMMLALLAGASPEDAARIANHAAGVVVGLVGTAPIELNELNIALAK